MDGRRTSKPNNKHCIFIIINNNNNNNNNNKHSTERFSAPISQDGGKCSHQPRPSGFKIFVGKYMYVYNSFYADDLQTMR